MSSLIGSPKKKIKSPVLSEELTQDHITIEVNVDVHAEHIKDASDDPETIETKSAEVTN